MVDRYEKGVRYEREIMKLFADNGYEVSRTAGSHSMFDTIAVKKTHSNEYITYICVLMQQKVKKVKK